MPTTSLRRFPSLFLFLVCAVCVSSVPIAAHAQSEEAPSIVWPAPAPTPYRAGVFAGGRVHTRDASAMAGVGVRMGADPKHDVAWQIDLLAERSIQSGAAYGINLGAGVAGHTRFGKVMHVRHGFGVRGGLISFGSSPTLPMEQRFWIAPVIASHVTFRAGKDIAIEVASEVVYAFLERGEHRSFRGLYLGVYAGPSFFF